MLDNKKLFERRKRRTRSRLRKISQLKPRLSVYRSGKHIYAQIIDDIAGKTIAAASTIDKELRVGLKKGTDCEAASQVGKLVANRAITAGVEIVVFDRGGYLYHGRVKALGDAAREAGLKF